MIDRLDKLPADVWDKLVLDAGLNETQLADLKTLFENKELWRNSERLVQVFRYLDDLGESAYISYDPRIIRGGLDYYTGVVLKRMKLKVSSEPFWEAVITLIWSLMWEASRHQVWVLLWVMW